MNLLEDEPLGKILITANCVRESDRFLRIEPRDAARRYSAASNSDSEKKKRDSRAAFSSESDAWIAFRSFDSAKSWRTVPCSASFGSVAPIAFRSAATASAFSSTNGMQGPEVMNVTSDLKNGRSRC